MCGRNSLFADQQDIEAVFGAHFTESYTPRYNIAPGEDLAIITNESPSEIAQYHWGLIPFWADEAQEGIINARSETVAEKQPFVNAWESRPCLVLSSGFYEWQQQNGGPKTPYRIHREDAPVFAMAGLWDVWEGDDRDLPCVTILTTEPNDLMTPVHDRMPVILPSEHEDRWLSGDPDERAELCQPYPAEDLTAYEISTQVNNPGNDTPEVIEPATSSQAGLDQFS